MSAHHSTPVRPAGRTGSLSPAGLLACGVAAGPLFVLVAAAQMATRDGFDIRRHPLSLLSLGDLGWVQIANFTVAGLLVIACAVGLRRALTEGTGRRWGPLLVGVFGVGLVMGGVFVTDPDLGFPPDAAVVSGDGSWHAVVHDVAPGLALDAVIVATVVYARRFRRLGRPGWAACSLAAGVAVLLLSWWPSQEGISIRLALAVTVAFGWLAALAGQTRARLAERPGRTPGS